MQFHNIHEQSYSLKCFLWLYLFVGNNDKFPYTIVDENFKSIVIGKLIVFY